MEGRHISSIDTSLIFILLVTCLNLALHPLSLSTSANSVPRSHHGSFEIPRTSHGRNHSGRGLGKIPLGQRCRRGQDCSNSSICLEKEFEDKEFEDRLMIKVCECDSSHMNRVKDACYVKPGYQCYFPGRNEHGQILLDCMEETECRSSVNRSMPEAGYCMCKDNREDEPFRELNVEKEIYRCRASQHFPNFVSFLTLVLKTLALKMLQY